MSDHAAHGGAGIPDPRRPVLVATRNRGKARELGQVLAGLGLTVIDLETACVPACDDESLVEDAPTLLANAEAKARYYHGRSGRLPTIADDSGLEVDCLGGLPGVRSRRWAGAVGDEQAVAAHNNRALLAAMTGCVDRGATFVTALAYVDADRTLTVAGAVRGRILHEPRGTQGFGYDPLFSCDELGGRTFGEVDVAAKASVSHRARAAVALAGRLREALPTEFWRP